MFFGILAQFRNFQVGCHSPALVASLRVGGPSAQKSISVFLGRSRTLSPSRYHGNIRHPERDVIKSSTGSVAVAQAKTGYACASNPNPGGTAFVGGEGVCRTPGQTASDGVLHKERARRSFPRLPDGVLSVKHSACGCRICRISKTMGVGHRALTFFLLLDCVLLTGWWYITRIELDIYSRIIHILR